jgi:hypothetical protein
MGGLLVEALELSFLTALAGNQHSLDSDGQPVIFEIVVTEVKEAEKDADAIQEHHHA